MIGIVCALKCEAKPLIENFSLKGYQKPAPYPLYYNEDMYLIISGIGKISAASATAYLFGLTSCTGWLNVGIGGHRNWPPGVGAFAHQILDRGNNRTYYPSFSWKIREKTTSVFTVDQVETFFEDEGIYEMEAAGFCSAAFRFSTAELIHCYKVVSDNLFVEAKPDKRLAKELIERNMGDIEKVIRKMQEITSNLSDSTIPFLEKWHFTVTQKYQLTRFLQRWQACYPHKNVWDTKINQLTTGKEVLQYLKQCFN